MSKEVADILRKAKLNLRTPDHWIINNTEEKRGAVYAYCLGGAIAEAANGDAHMWRSPAFDAVGDVIKRRHAEGRLPIPKFSGGGANPVPWDIMLVRGNGIAQFNNSSTYVEVIALLDEVIAEQDGPPKPEPEVETTPSMPEPGTGDDDSVDGDDTEEDGGTEVAEPAARERVLEYA